MPTITAIALITGASGSIGCALARQLQSMGCRVAAVSRHANRLADVRAAVHIAADTTTRRGGAVPERAAAGGAGAGLPAHI